SGADIASTGVDTEPRIRHDLKAIHQGFVGNSWYPIGLTKACVNPIGCQNGATESAGEPAPVGWPTGADVGEVRRFQWARERAWLAAELARNRGKLVGNADAGRGRSRRRWLTVLGEASARPRSAPRMSVVRRCGQRLSRESLPNPFWH